MFEKPTSRWTARIASALSAIACLAVVPTQAATVPMTAGNHYFAGWRWSELPFQANPKAASCFNSGTTSADGTVMVGSLYGQTFTVTNLQPGTRLWAVCYGIASSPPPGTDLPVGGVGEVQINNGDVELAVATPLPAGTLLEFEDLDNRESATITFRDCSGKVIDPSGFDLLELSDVSVPAIAASVPTTTVTSSNWTVASPVNVNIPNYGFGILMHSADVCRIEVNAPKTAAGGGFGFALGTPAPLVTVSKSLEPDTVIPVGANRLVVFELTVANAANPALNQPAGYRFYEVVPAGTTFTGIVGATTDCVSGAAAGTLCTVTVTDPIPPGTSRTVRFTVTTEATLPIGTRSVFNAATQDASIQPANLGWGCTASGSVCRFPPTGPACPAYPQGTVCASAPTATPSVSLAKSVNSSTPDPVGPGEDVVFDLTATNSTPGTIGYGDPNLDAFYVWEIVPQNTTFKSLSANASSNCSPGAAAGTLCYIQFIHPIAYGSPEAVQFVVTTDSPLPAGTTGIFNAATPVASDPSDPGGSGLNVPPGCAFGFDPVTSKFNSFCSSPPLGPACPTAPHGTVCASAPTVTTMTVTKSVSGGPPGYSGGFAITLTCKDANGNDTSGMLTPSATQTVSAGTDSPGAATFGNIPAGGTCSVSESTLPPAPASYAWSAPSIAQPPGPITGPVSAAVTNRLVRQVSGLTVVKTVTGGPAGYAGSFPISVACTLGGAAVSGITPSATQNVLAAVGGAGQAHFGNIPQGAQCTVSEGPLPAAPASYVWNPPAITQPAAISAAGSIASVANALTQQFGSLVVTKTVSGGPAGYSGSFPISVACSLEGAAVSGIAPSAVQLVSAGAGASGQLRFGNIPQGALCTVSEGVLPDAPANYAWKAPAITQPATISATDSAAAVANALTALPPIAPIESVPGLRKELLWLLFVLLAGGGVAGSRRFSRIRIAVK